MNKYNLGEKVMGDIQKVKTKCKENQNEGQFIYSWKKLEEPYGEGDSPKILKKLMHRTGHSDRENSKSDYLTNTLEPTLSKECSYFRKRKFEKLHTVPITSFSIF